MISWSDVEERKRSLQGMRPLERVVDSTKGSPSGLRGAFQPHPRRTEDNHYIPDKAFLVTRNRTNDPGTSKHIVIVTSSEEEGQDLRSCHCVPMGRANENAAGAYLNLSHS